MAMCSVRLGCSGEMATQDLEAVIIEDDEEEKQVLTKITSI